MRSISAEAWAVCIDLPTRGMDDAAATADWGVVATPDGRSNLAVNATLGIDRRRRPGDLTIRRAVDFEPSARRGITLAKFGHIEAGSVGRRVVAAPDGSAVFAAGARGIVRIDTADLTVTARSLEGIAVDAIAHHAGRRHALRARPGRRPDRPDRRGHGRGARLGRRRGLRPPRRGRALVR